MILHEIKSEVLSAIETFGDKEKKKGEHTYIVIRSTSLLCYKMETSICHSACNIFMKENTWCSLFFTVLKLLLEKQLKTMPQDYTGCLNHRQPVQQVRHWNLNVFPQVQMRLSLRQKTWSALICTRNLVRKHLEPFIIWIKYDFFCKIQHVFLFANQTNCLYMSRFTQLQYTDKKSS